MAAVVLVCIWLISGVLIVASGLLHLCNPNLPQIFRDLLLYGKVRGKRKEWTPVRKIEVPKRWFIHFYTLGMVVNGSMFCIACATYLLGVPPPDMLLTVLSAINVAELPTVGVGPALLVVLMMVIQDTRRLYECVYVSVYSNSTINIMHYFLGIYHYSAFSFAVLVEAPPFERVSVSAVLDELLQPQIGIALMLFLWASQSQYQCNVIFANLRKDKTGNVTGLHHRVPQGGWFQYVSCPHYLFEVIIYIAMVTVTGLNHLGVSSAVIFVIFNQFTAASITHYWYKNQYKGYPVKRKAIIPFLF